MTQIAILGCGAVGLQLAQRHRAQGHAVDAWLRNPERARRLDALGVSCHLGDLAQSRDLDACAGRLVYYLAPPPGPGTTDPTLRQLLSQLRQTPPRRLVYVSTSGVYGDCQGAWIDETAPPQPGSDRARRRLDAEQACQAFAEALGIGWAVLRVGGIYGPARLPRERLRRQEPIVEPDQAPFSNRIHEQDLLQVLQAAGYSEANGVFNICDDAPSSMSDYFLQVAAHLGMAPPPTLPLQQALEALSPAMGSYLRESRRMRNRRMKEALGVVLRYPSLADGLAAMGQD